MSEDQVQKLLKIAIAAKQKAQNGGNSSNQQEGGFHLYFKGKQTTMHTSRKKFSENDYISSLKKLLS